MTLAVLLHYLFWRGGLSRRFIIPLAPVFCILAARGCAALLDSGRKPLRLAGAAALAVALAHSAWLCVAGRLMRRDDPRTRAARFLSSTFPHGTRIGMGMTSKILFTTNSWTLPHLDERAYGVSSMLSLPPVLALSSADFEPIEQALRSPKLLPGYRWDPRHNADWFLSAPPSPDVFLLYDEILHRPTAYRLAAVFKTPLLAPIEFPPPEIRIYRLTPRG